jgi:hypothetical protein
VCSCSRRPPLFEQAPGTLSCLHSNHQPPSSQTACRVGAGPAACPSVSDTVASAHQLVTGPPVTPAHAHHALVPAPDFEGATQASCCFCASHQLSLCLCRPGGQTCEKQGEGSSVNCECGNCCDSGKATAHDSFCAPGRHSHPKEQEQQQAGPSPDSSAPGYTPAPKIATAAYKPETPG